MESKQNINSSSIIDLKAELFRKQEEFKQQKLRSNNATFIKAKTTEKKPTIWSKQNVGVLQRAQKDIEQKVDEEDQYEKTKKSLERKSKLYEEISKGKGIPEEDGSKVFLVDFQKKAIDNIREERNRQRENEERIQQGEDVISDADIPPPKDEGEEWVDYTDSLGRSRRCMKKDLPKLMSRDQDLVGKEKVDRKATLPDNDDMPTLMSDDMRKEMLRQKWEKEELEAMNGPIHYSNVRFDEIRSHGVGFFQFDKSEESRQEQLDTLNQLRQQTVEERSRKEKLKEKRKAMLDARLAKVKQRKMMREGGSIGPDIHLRDEEESDIGPKIEEMIKPPEKASKPELLTRDETARLNKPTREWDKGKEKLFPPTSEERYFKERRDDRNPQFAPPMSLYTDNTPKQECQQDKRQKPLQSSWFDHGEVPPPPSVHKDANMMEAKNASENIKIKTTNMDSLVINIPLPAAPSTCQPGNSEGSSYNAPFFDFSVPPPNMMPLPTLQPTLLPNQQYYPYPGPSDSSSNQFCYPTGSVPPNYHSIYQTDVELSNYNQSQAFPQSQSIETGHVTTPIQTGTSSVSSNTEIQLKNECSPVTVTQPPKPKLNIIDPRFIQNQDVLSKNPGNMSSEKGFCANQDNIQTDDESISDDIAKTSADSSSTKTMSYYSSKPVIYR